ncbi:hypothetical protein Tsubulata_024377 [Turnera subulata]|uniref:DUF7870 domain-containing protein n=1 Tax=Turnera subulata TaxID=218843 RepID=A0A9Q0JRD4_9ROSI|nr:hypothetical protein Tsubulata_024377 [Turnera subulata]
MESSRGYRASEHNKMRGSQNGVAELNSGTRLVIRFSDVRALRVLSHSVFLAMVILTLPFMAIRGLPSGYHFDASLDDFGGFDTIDVDFLDLLLQDLANEGLVKKGDKAIIVTSGVGAVLDSSWLLSAGEVDLVPRSELEQEVSFPNATFDFALTFGVDDVVFVDRIVKVGGIVVTQLNKELSNPYQKQSNYKIVYLRKYDSTIVAMRKSSLIGDLVESPAKRRPLQLAAEAKKAALKGLEDVLLEPPRKALVKYRKKFKYLPDLLGDPLEDYPRRVFISLGLQEEEEKNSILTWFDENYPTRSQEFEFHCFQIPSEGFSNKTGLFADVSNWLMNNVREDDFVVMKAEAEVVEEMIRTGIIGLVDELFLECQSQWQKGHKSKRAYWECLALYGRLRDAGVAVHQWWN